ncbi:MAG: hypothetical protein Q8Q09_12620 [Deltaproteobacteria bacterium]|nr:hypothetical protein [Deltaproteobacteria bacterium]
MSSQSGAVSIKPMDLDLPDMGLASDNGLIAGHFTRPPTVSELGTLVRVIRRNVRAFPSATAVLHCMDTDTIHSNQANELREMIQLMQRELEGLSWVSAAVVPMGGFRAIIVRSVLTGALMTVARSAVAKVFDDRVTAIAWLTTKFPEIPHFSARMQAVMKRASR